MGSPPADERNVKPRPNEQPPEATRPTTKGIQEAHQHIRQLTEDLQRAIGWNNTLPARLRERLIPRAPLTTLADHGLPEGPIILCLYAGPDGHDAIDWAIQLEAPWLTPYVVALDTRRDAKRHDMLSDDLYGHLAEKSRQGDMLALTGGPECKTWSIKLHAPLPDGTPGHPLRGRLEPDCWGLPDLTEAQQAKVDDDSVLALRMLELYAIAKVHGHDPAFLLEHPEDPAIHSIEPTAHICATIWETRALQAFRDEYGMLATSFPQSALGDLPGPKWTTALHKHLGGLRKLGDLTHEDDNARPKCHSSKLARWAPGFCKAIATSLTRALPQMRNWTNQTMTDRPKDNISATAKHATPDIQVTIGHKQRPLRDGGGKPSPGRKHPAQRSHPLRKLGAALMGMAANELAHDTEAQGATLALASGKCKECPYQDRHLATFSSTIAEYAHCGMDRAPGQPFCLDAITCLARMAGDPDADFPQQCKEGLPLGVEEHLPDTSRIWPSKQELADEDGLQEADEEQLPPPQQAENYPSAAEHEAAIEATFLEEVQLGLVSGPHTDEEAAQICGCTPDQLCHGALAGKLEGRYNDKLRTIHDGTVNKVNPWIKRNQKQRTTAPTLADLMTGLGLTSRVRRRLLKLDASKAHRRIKILRKDWKYMTARTSRGVWVNKVGTYGVASAQYHWGRMAAIILRLIYYTFPHLLWAFVYVDDFAAIVPDEQADTTLFALLMFLCALGLPISWKKVEMHHTLGWLGYLVAMPTHTALLTPDKQTTIMGALALLGTDTHISLETARQIAGRLNWATMVYPPMRAFLQPVFAWVSALLQRQERQKWGQATSRTPRRLRIAASHLSAIFMDHIPPHTIVTKTANYAAATDAGARDTEQGPDAYVGGWYGARGATRDQVKWFYIKITPELHPWAYHKGHPRLCIAALELYGTLLLYRHMVGTERDLLGPINLTLALQTDNKGNAYQATNHKAHNDLAANFLMELAMVQYTTGVPLSLSHTYRENNTWADQLTHADTSGFTADRQFHPKECDWHVLGTLQDATKLHK